MVGPDRLPASRELLCNQFGDHAPFASHRCDWAFGGHPDHRRGICRFSGLYGRGPTAHTHQKTLIILAFLGLVPTAGANLIRVLLIRSAGPVFMSLTNYQVPMWSVILGILVLGEPMHNSLFIALS